MPTSTRTSHEVKTAFKRLVNLVPRRGLLVAWDGHPNVDECVSRAFCRVERYGFGESSTWRITDIEYTPNLTRWKVARNAEPWGDFEFSLAGEYNVLNATAAAAMAANYGISADAIAEALRSFHSVKRRLEVRVGSSRHYHHRRLRAPPDCDRGNAKSSARTLSGTALVGDSGAAFEYSSPQSISDRIGPKPRSGR